jgi:undecaprenyl diphosphate synthase
MDGNGRWAQARGKARIQGHRRGVETARQLTSLCGRAGIEYLTLFAFSSENWKRPPEEVGFLTRLLITSLENEISRLQENQIRLNIIGDFRPFGQKVEELIVRAHEQTSSNTAMTLTIALNYGGRWDLTEAVRKLVRACEERDITADDIDEATLSQALSTRNLPDPDLFIRTGGEIRLSNFLLWQLAYTELFFTDCLWPDFDEDQFERALDAYRSRQRRFGQTGDQVTA